MAYRGQFAAGVFEGQGSAYEEGVLVYQGNFSQGFYEGEGTLYDENGSVLYQGQFVQGSRQGAGTVYDQVGSAVYSGEFVDDGVNYMSYLGKGTEEITAAFGAPGYQTQAGGYTLLSYLNLGASFLCADGGDGTLVCRFVLMDANQGFLGITPASTEEELEELLGTRFTTLTGNLSQERIQAVSQLSLSVPEKGRVDKYLMSNYYIKVYYNAQDQIAAVEMCIRDRCGTGCGWKAHCRITPGWSFLSIAAMRIPSLSWARAVKSWMTGWKRRMERPGKSFSAAMGKKAGTIPWI